MPSDSELATDPLAEVLGALRMTSVFCCRTQARAPWAMEMPAIASCLSFHLVVAGQVRVEVGGADAVVAGAGELVLVPHGRGHLLSSAAGVPSSGRADLLPQRHVTDAFSVLELDGPGDVARLVCGIVGFEGPTATNLVRALPRLVHVDRTSPSTTSPIRLALELLALEVERARPGGAAVTTRLADVIVIQALRWWLAHGGGHDAAWVRALLDDQVGPALRAVHQEPGRRWTVATLAREARMSRSAFAARFAGLTDDTVMSYVTRWRMQVASELLALDPGRTVADVASRVGYRSEAAFSRAFRRETGHPPGAARR